MDKQEVFDKLQAIKVSYPNSIIISQVWREDGFLKELTTYNLCIIFQSTHHPGELAEKIIKTMQEREHVTTEDWDQIIKHSKEPGYTLTALQEIKKNLKHSLGLFVLWEKIPQDPIFKNFKEEIREEIVKFLQK